MDTKQPSGNEPVLFRYWQHNWSSIRISWSSHTAWGIQRDDGSIAWQGGDVVPECLALAARDCLADQYEHGVPGCEYDGEETEQAMDAACDAAWVEQEARRTTIAREQRESAEQAAYLVHQLEVAL